MLSARVRIRTQVRLIPSHYAQLLLPKTKQNLDCDSERGRGEFQPPPGSRITRTTRSEHEGGKEENAKLVGEGVGRGSSVGGGGGREAGQAKNVLRCIIRGRRGALLAIFLKKSNTGRKQFIKMLHTLAVTLTSVLRRKFFFKKKDKLFLPFFFFF